MDHHAQVVRVVDVFSYTHSDSKSKVIPVTVEKFGINDARILADTASLRPDSNYGQIFVVTTTFVTLEAQNALLKLFEEPPVGTRFVLVLPPAFQLLDTLRSRIGIETIVAGTTTSLSWTAFYEASITDRLAQIDFWQKQKDALWLGAIVDGVQNINCKGFDTATMQAVQIVAEKLQTRGASNKMLLEHLALALPLHK